MTKFCLSVVAFALSAAAACGGQIGPSPTDSDTKPPPSPTTPAPLPSPSPAPTYKGPTPVKDAGPYCPPDTDPSWTLDPTKFDHSCTQDSDCEIAYFGTAVCTQDVPLCFCGGDAIAKTSDAAYQAARLAFGNQCDACRPPDPPRGCLCPAAKVICSTAQLCVACAFDDPTCGN